MSLMDLLLNAPSAQDRYQQVAGLMGGPGSPPPAQGSNIGPTGGSSDWERTARQYFLEHGYSRPEWRAVDSIIERESGWDPNAVNESSGAYGIPQILPSAHPNANLQNDPMGQIQWLANYINERYGGAFEALEFKDREGWY